MITPNFDALKLWFLEASNKMVVETCKNIPMTTALIYAEYCSSTSKFCFNQLPKGVIRAKRHKNRTTWYLLILLFRRKTDNIAATGILCTTTPWSKWLSWSIGNPSKSECILKLTNNSTGKWSSWWWMWPCSTPFERNSSTIWNKRPSKMNSPILLPPALYTSGRSSNTVTDSK